MLRLDAVDKSDGASLCTPPIDVSVRKPRLWQTKRG